MCACDREEIPTELKFQTCKITINVILRITCL